MSCVTFKTITIDVRGFTVLVLAVFTCITICGVKESSIVTLFLFSVHICVITILVLWGFIYGIQDGFSVFTDNMLAPQPIVISTSGMVLGERSVFSSIIFGYSSALLGITGFETASNYIEDLNSPTVFVSTVNWMW